MTFKAVIFDIDGTLVDSINSYKTAFNRGTAKFGLPPVEAEPLLECLTQGMNLEEVLQKVHPDQCSNDDGFVQACRQEIYAAFLSLTDDVELLIPDVVDVLRELEARGIKMGVATGRTSKSSRVRQSFRKLGIDHFFEAVVTTADVKDKKPAPDVIIECARQLGVEVADCLVVGDAVADVEAAKSAGATVAAVLTGVSTEAKLTPYGPDKMYRKLSEILELFD